MSKRYSVRLFGPDKEDYEAVQLTAGQFGRLMEWMSSWADHSARRSFKRGAVFGGGLTTAVYCAWAWFDWAVL